MSKTHDDLRWEFEAIDLKEHCTLTDLERGEELAKILGYGCVKRYSRLIERRKQQEQITRETFSQDFV